MSRLVNRGEIAYCATSLSSCQSVDTTQPLVESSSRSRGRVHSVDHEVVMMKAWMSKAWMSISSVR